MSSLFLVIVAVFAAGLAALLFWAVREPRRQQKRTHGPLEVLERAPQHVCNMNSIRQSMDASDLKYVLEKRGAGMAKRLRHERRQVAFLYLSAIREDFEELLRVARVVALLSPEVSPLHEYDRLRLTILFRARYQLLRLRLRIGSVAMPELHALGEMVSTLAVQMETAMAELGERTALAAGAALQADR